MWNNVMVQIFGEWHHGQAIFDEIRFNRFLWIVLGTYSAWRFSLKTSPRPEKNRTKTGLSKDCSLGLSNFQTKDRRKTGLYGPVETGLLCPSITPSNVAQEHVNWLKTDWDIQHFAKCSITTGYFIDIFISSSILAHFGHLRARFET